MQWPKLATAQYAIPQAAALQQRTQVTRTGTAVPANHPVYVLALYVAS